METTITSRPDPLLQPPGFRFYPTEEELLSFYLRHRLAGTRPDVERFIPVVDIYSHHPHDLQRMAGVDDPEQWFFFCPRAAREAHGGRPARTTPSGYWKATGSPSWVFSSSSSSSSSTTTAAAGGDRRVIGEKRTMVFYTGRAPAGTKTRWKMNEYKAVVDDDVADHAPAAAGEPAPLRLRNEFSVCRVYISTGTVRCFDRRPLDLNDHAAGHDRPIAAPHHHRQQQRRQLVVVPPLPAANSTSRNNNNNQLAASGCAVQTAAENNPLDGPSSSSGLLRGMVVDDDDDDDGADVDWDSLMLSPPPVGDGFSFDADDLARMLS